MPELAHRPHLRPAEAGKKRASVAGLRRRRLLGRAAAGRFAYFDERLKARRSCLRVMPGREGKRPSALRHRSPLARRAQREHAVERLRARPPGTPRGSPAPRRRRWASCAPGRCRSRPSRAPAAARATAPSAAYSAGILLGSEFTSSIQALTPSAYACQRVLQVAGQALDHLLALGLRVVVAPGDDVVLERRPCR